MSAELVCRNAEGFVVQVTIPYVDSMLKFEEAIHYVGGLEWQITDTISV